MHTLHGTVTCPLCGKVHRNPQMWYLFESEQEGAMIVCPNLSSQFKMRYFPLSQEAI